MDSIVNDFAKLVERGLVNTIDGKFYSSVPMHRVTDNRALTTLEIETLSSFRDYIKEKIDLKSLDELFVVVEDYTSVNLYGHLDPESLVRKNYIRAKLGESLNFRFGEFYAVEDFLIRLRSLFKQTPDRDKLLSFAATITNQEKIEIGDDGVSQRVMVSKGMSGAIKAVENAPLTMLLAPYRTFREVEQPASEFLFRIRESEGKMPSCALFEADGGSWKIQAMKNISAWLKSNIKNIPILS